MLIFLLVVLCSRLSLTSYCATNTQTAVGGGRNFPRLPALDKKVPNSLQKQWITNFTTVPLSTRASRSNYVLRVENFLYLHKKLSKLPIQPVNWENMRLKIKGSSCFSMNLHRRCTEGSLPEERLGRGPRSLRGGVEMLVLLLSDLFSSWTTWSSHMNAAHVTIGIQHYLFLN